MMVIAVLAASAVAALSMASAAPPSNTNPLAGRNLYVDPYSSAADAARRDPAGSAEQLAAAQIAAGPQARWFTDSDSAGSVGR